MIEIRIILIDDEYYSLLWLKKLLETEYHDAEVIGVYQDAIQLLDNITSLSPDVIFLDVQMPDINGLELAVQIQELNPNVSIVFVTGYSSYARNAFDLEAVDFIMKPIKLKRLKKTIERLRKHMKSNYLNCETPISERKIYLSCFNHLKYQVEGSEQKLFKWRTSKSEELFAYLLYHRNKIVHKETLIELLWPDFEYTAGAQQLYSTIYQIRLLLTRIGLEAISINSTSGGYCLYTRNTLIDTEIWENQVNQLGEPSEGNVMEYEMVFFQYTGDYLGDYGYLWKEGEKERLRRLWVDVGLTLSSYYKKTSNTDKVIKIHQKIQHLYPEEEESYFELMKIYASKKMFQEVDQQWEKLDAIFTRELNISPSKKIVDWYKKNKYKHEF